MRSVATRGFRILTEDQCARLHEASLRILGTTGVRYLDPSAVRTLVRGGATVSGDDVVHLPRDLVDWSIRVAPREVVLHDRGGREPLRLADRRTYFGTGSDCHNILDPRTGEHRRFTKPDIEAGIGLCDALPNIDLVLSIGLASDVPTGASDVHQFDAMVRNTTKPIVFTAHDATSAATIVAMAEAVAGGVEALARAPFAVHFAEVDCPLKLAAETCRKLVLLAGMGIPIIQGAGPMMGATGPQTSAGALAQANAECLAGNVLVQLVREGSPFICGLGIHPFDMRTGILPYGAPELSRNMAAACDLARWYGLPTWGYAGCSDAKAVDQQAAVEATASIIASLLSGANLVHDVGYLESGLTSAFEMIVLADLVIEYGRAMLQDIEISDETLALDVIDAVGHDGNHLAEDHTYRHFREVWYSDLVDRWSRERWLAAGAPSMGDRLRARVLELLEAHRPPPLPVAAGEELERLVAEATERALSA